MRAGGGDAAEGTGSGTAAEFSGALGDLRGLLHAYPWLAHAHALDSVSVEQELGFRFRSLRRIPRNLVTALAEKLGGALAALLCPGFPQVRAAKVWTLLPRLLLGAVLDPRPQPRARRAPRQRGIRTVLRDRLRRLEAGEWPGLLADSRTQGPGAAATQPDEDAPAGWDKAREMVRFARLGQVGKAAARLTSAGVAPWSQAVEDRLRELVAPQAGSPPTASALPPDNPVQLDFDNFRRRLRRAPRESAPGPTGLRSDHLQLLL